MRPMIYAGRGHRAPDTAHRKGLHMSGITTTYAGRAAIAPGSGDQHAAFTAALVAGDVKHPGFSLDEAVIRLTAAGAPLWARKVGAADLAWCVRKPSTQRSKARGTVHVFAHRAEAGATERCSASGDNAHGECSATTVSKGDAVKRWRTDDDANGPADTRVQALAPAALMGAFVATFRGQVEYLRGRGHGEADFLATPGISQRIAALEKVAGKAASSKAAELLADAPAPKKAATKRTAKTAK